jgi:hypothetical protein
VKAEEPAAFLSLALDAIEGRIPFDGLAHAGDGARDECVEATPDVAFPARHGCDVGLHGGVAAGLRDCGLPPARRAGFATLRILGFSAVLRGLAAFEATRLVATFVDSMDVLLAIAFTRGCLRDSPADRLINDCLLVCDRSRAGNIQKVSCADIPDK